MVKSVERTEFQEALQALIDRGDLDLRERRSIYYPLKLTKQFEDTYIDFLTHDARSTNALKRGEIMNFGDLIENWDNLKTIRNLGDRSYKVIRNAFINAYYQSLSVDGKAKFLADIIELNSKPEKDLVEAQNEV